MPPSDLPDWVRQVDADVALDWGPNGLRAVGDGVAAVVVVDVLRFTTAVDVAVGRGARVIAHRWDRPDDAVALAEARGALLGGRVGDEDPGLSPGSLTELAPGQRIVLPSPNGSALVMNAAERGAGQVVAACLRNATAVGAALAGIPGRIAVIAAGERWRGATGPLRVAVEDHLGAGAVASTLRAHGRRLSPEATIAADAFEASRHRLTELLATCASGRELVARGARGSLDVAMAADLDVSDAVPTLVGDELRDAAGRATRSAGDGPDAAPM